MAISKCYRTQRAASINVLKARGLRPVLDVNVGTKKSAGDFITGAKTLLNPC